MTFEPDQTEANITITLQQNIVIIHISYTESTLHFLISIFQVPISGETFTVKISSDADGIDFGVTTATVTAFPSGFSVFQFRQASRFE